MQKVCRAPPRTPAHRARAPARPRAPRACAKTAARAACTKSAPNYIFIKVPPSLVPRDAPPARGPRPGQKTRDELTFLLPETQNPFKNTSPTPNVADPRTQICAKGSRARGGVPVRFSLSGIKKCPIFAPRGPRADNAKNMIFIRCTRKVFTKLDHKKITKFKNCTKVTK